MSRASILSFVFLLTTSAAFAAEPPKLLILDIRGVGVPEETTRSLTDLLELEVERGGLYTVLSEQDLRTMVKLEETKLMLGEDEEFQKRMAQIAGEVGAPYVLAASLGRVGEAYVLSLELMDAKAIEVKRRITQTLVGSPEGLVGSMRTAALALNLEEKGLTPDISAELIDDLKIGEKPKTLYLTLGPTGEFPVGDLVSDESILTLNPLFLHFGLTGELPMWPWVRLYATLSVGFSINEGHRQEVQRASVLSGTSILRVSSISMDYSALQIPFVVGVKVAPDTGRFLPFARAAVGVSWQNYAFENAKYGEAYAADSCPQPFEGPSGDPQMCSIDVELAPRKDLSLFGLDVRAEAGFEWLLTHNFAVSFLAGYHLTWLPADTEDLRVAFEGQTGTEPDTYSTFQLFAVQELQHYVVFAANAIVYW